MTEQAGGEFRGPIPGTGGTATGGPTVGGGPAGSNAGNGRPMGRHWGGTGGPAGPWGWTDAMDRPHLPWFGVFLVLFGGLLLLEQLVPGTRALGSGLVVAVGLALLIAWAVNRHLWQLYAGAILFSLSLPSLLQDLNVIREGPGWGTLFLGIAFLLIALIRAGTRGGLGWQAIVGGVLAVIGGAQVAEREIPNFPSLDRLVWPALILVLGLLLVTRSLGARRPPRV